MRIMSVIALALVVLQPVETPALGQSMSESVPQHEIIITDLMIPMRDGVNLNARLYRPIDLGSLG